MIVVDISVSQKTTQAQTDQRVSGGSRLANQEPASSTTDIVEKNYLMLSCQETRSQAVAKIADRTASQQADYVINSNCC